MMDKFELQKLRDLPIEGVAERLGLKVKLHKALCPFHPDKHPSLSFNTHRNTCRCYVCMTESLGPIDLVMQYLHKDFKESCEWLADSHNVILTECPQTFPLKGARGSGSFTPSRYERFFEHPWLSPEACRFLFDERHLDPRVVRWCRLNSYQDKQGGHWLQIPYYDVDGKLIGLQNRRTPRPPLGGDDGQPRFKFPYGSQCSVYNLPMLRRLKPGDECWIAEGSSDAWSHMSDHHKVIAIASATLLKPNDKQLLQEVTARLSIRWKMAPDQDAPGRRLAAQLKEILPMLDIVELPEGVKDYSDFYLLKKSQSTNDYTHL